MVSSSNPSVPVAWPLREGRKGSWRATIFLDHPSYHSGGSHRMKIPVPFQGTVCGIFGYLPWEQHLKNQKIVGTAPIITRKYMAMKKYFQILILPKTPVFTAEFRDHTRRSPQLITGSRGPQLDLLVSNSI